MRMATKGGSTKGRAAVRRGSAGRAAAPREAQEARTAESGPAVGPFRVVLADRRLATLSEVALRLERAGHQVVARVASMRAALENAEYFKPDVLLVASHLEDGLGVAAALACAKLHPEIAPVVLIPHPGASNPAARPDWGNVALAPMDASAEDLDAILRAAVSRTRSAGAGAVAALRGARAAR
jgi:DNA-binding NarL/FixJ family response regulator